MDGSRGSVQVPAVPEDVDDPALVKASGVVTLPQHIRWSGPDLSYDLADRRQRARVYEQVLREGNDDDVRFYVDVDLLLQVWDQMFLPRPVRAAWAGWFARHRGLALGC